MDLREVYKKEEGMFTVCSDADGNTYSTEDYVEWLEEKLVKLLTIPVVVGRSELLCECNHAGLRGEPKCKKCIKNMEECEF